MHNNEYEEIAAVLIQSARESSGPTTQLCERLDAEAIHKGSLPLERRVEWDVHLQRCYFCRQKLARVKLQAAGVDVDAILEQGQSTSGKGIMLRRITRRSDASRPGLAAAATSEGTVVIESDDEVWRANLQVLGEALLVDLVGTDLSYRGQAVHIQLLADHPPDVLAEGDGVMHVLPGGSGTIHAQIKIETKIETYAPSDILKRLHSFYVRRSGADPTEAKDWDG